MNFKLLKNLFFETFFILITFKIKKSNLSKLRKTQIYKNL